MTQHAVSPPRTAKLFRNGASQAVRLPAEFKFDGDEVYIWRDEATGAVVLAERKKVEWDHFLAVRAKHADANLANFMKDREQPPVQERSGLGVNEDEGV